MSKFIGRLADIGFAKEAVRGTPLDPTFWVPQLSLTFDEMVEQVLEESSVGVIEDSVDRNITEKIANGTLEGRIAAESFGLLLLNAIGDVSSAVAAGESVVFDHTFSVLQSAQHPSLTISVKEPNSSKRYALGMLNSLVINVALNQYAQFTSDIRAKIGVDASLTPVYVAADEKKIFLPQHGEFKVASTIAGLDAAQAINIKSFSISIEKNLEDDQVLGSLDPSDILNKQFAIEGTVELLYNDQTFIDDLLADTKQAMRLEIKNTDITIGSAENPTLTFDFAKVSFSEVTKPFTNNDLTVQTFSFKAHYDLTTTKMLDVILTNETTSY